LAVTALGKPVDSVRAFVITVTASLPMAVNLRDYLKDVEKFTVPVKHINKI
jgi:hypothetical protein